MNTPHAWDLKIIADLERDIARLHAIIGTRTEGEIVRDNLGDSRPETVGQMRARIARKESGVLDIKRQFPEYFGL